MSLWFCIHNLLKPPQDFLLPFQILSGDKLEVVAEILRVCVECAVHSVEMECSVTSSSPESDLWGVT